MTDKEKKILEEIKEYVKAKIKEFEEFLKTMEEAAHEDLAYPAAIAPEVQKEREERRKKAREIIARARKACTELEQRYPALKELPAEKKKFIAEFEQYKQELEKFVAQAEKRIEADAKKDIAEIKAAAKSGASGAPEMNPLEADAIKQIADDLRSLCKKLKDWLASLAQ